MAIIHNINWVDLLVLVLLARSVYMGTRRGLTAELFNFIGIIISLVFSVHWYGYVADVLIANLSLPIWFSQFLCFVIIAQIIRLIFKYGLALVLKILNVQFLPQFERVGGAIIGIGRGIFIASIVLISMAIIPNNYLTESIYGKSFSGVFFIKAAERTYKVLTFWVPNRNTEDKDIFYIPATETKVRRN